MHQITLFCFYNIIIYIQTLQAAQFVGETTTTLDKIWKVKLKLGCQSKFRM